MTLTQAGALTFAEANSRGNLFGMPGANIEYYLNDPTIIFKRGISMNILTQEPPNFRWPDGRIRRRGDPLYSEVNSGGITIGIHTPPDNGGEVSGIYVAQSGGGNGISVFNYDNSRDQNGVPLPGYPAVDPSGRPYPEYANQGYGIEVQTGPAKHAVYATAHDASAFLGGGNGSGDHAVFLARLDLGTNVEAPTKRAYGAFRSVGDVNNPGQVETFYTTFGGDLYSQRSITVGNIAVGTHPGATLDVNGSAYFSGFVTADSATSFALRRYSGTLDQNGEAAVPHGLNFFATPILTAQVYYRGNSGEMVPMTIHAIDGNFVFTKGGPGGRKFRVTLTYSNQPDPNW
jgi:hypothetical protein